MARPKKTSADVPEKARRFGACEPAAVRQNCHSTTPARAAAKTAAAATLSHL
jgi:hypothetical protein